MKKLVICALAMGGFAACAQAADLDTGSFKDPLPDSLTYKGVTIYGTIDVGYSYSSNSAPVNGANYVTQPWTLQGIGRREESVLVDNALEISHVGVKIEEGIGGGFVAVGKIETQFNPISGELADACASLVRNNGVAPTAQSWNTDGSRCGQAFGGEAYGGISNAGYGTLTIGRQTSLNVDLGGTYDPQGGSQALSLLGFSATGFGGSGATSNAFWDNSIKYRIQYGPVHGAVQYADGDTDSSILGYGIAGDIGLTWGGFSIDTTYTEVKGATQAGTLAAGQCGTPSTVGCQTNNLAGIIQDDAAWSIEAKYTWELGGGYKDVSFKDGYVPSARVSILGGYIRVDRNDPDSAYNGLKPNTGPTQAGHAGYNVITTIGGYAFAYAQSNVFETTNTLQTEWGGVKYETGPWTFVGAYYHSGQNAFESGGYTCATAPKPTTGVKVAGNCAGDIQDVSFLADYAFSKHFDVYAGYIYSDATGGVASGFLSSSNNSFVTGMRIKF